jgi:hypothetical protein
LGFKDGGYTLAQQRVVIDDQHAYLFILRMHT